MTDLAGLYDAVESHQRASGWFDVVAMHEPKSRPGPGLTAATWLQRVTPAPLASGLNATTSRVEVVTRIYTPMLSPDDDRIDPAVYTAADTLVAAYTADLSLGGRVRNVDALGAHGDPLQIRAGYVNHSGTLLRIMDVITPLIVNDTWPQAH